MAQYSTKVLANIGPSSPVGGNTNPGYWTPVYVAKAALSSIPNATTTGVPIFMATNPCTVVGVGVAQQAAATNNVTYSFKKVPVANQTPVAICSTQPILATTAAFPASSQVVTINGTAATNHTGTTGVTDPVLTTTTATLQLAAGDIVTVDISASGASTSAAAAFVFVRDDNGSY